MNFHKYCFISLLVIFIVCFTVTASAHEICENISTTQSPNTGIINESNFNDYFDENSTLKHEYTNTDLIFNGNFTNYGVLKINTDNISITGKSRFINTAICINASNIRLSNIEFSLNESFDENEHSGILILKNNICLDNVKINYNTSEFTAIGIYSKNTDNIIIVNSEINFIGKSLNHFNYAVLINHAHNLIVINNTINSSLPLRGLVRDYETYGRISTIASAGLAISNVNRMNLENNKFYGQVNNRVENYANLDLCFLYDCNDTVIKGNAFILKDDFTPIRKDNSLYDLYIHRSSNLTLISNDLKIKTSGGSPDSGVSYPVEIIGPADDIKIALNSISCECNSQSCGIFSKICENSKISIISNSIDVKGNIGNNYYSFLTGIEAENTENIILNNTITVNGVGNTNKIYGISYTQYTGGKHTFDIEYNTVSINGIYTVYLKEANNSLIVKNKLTSKNNKTSCYITGMNNTVRYNTAMEDTEKMPDEMLPDWLVKPIEKTVKSESKKTVQKKKTAITAKKINLKVKKTRKYTVTLKAGKKAVKKVKVTLKVGKKTYRATTDSKGKAVFKLKINKKGKYTGLIKFKGNNSYKSSTRKVKITVKK